MVTKKVRYVIFKIESGNNTLLKMSEESLLNIFRDQMYEMYGSFGMMHFQNVYITLFLLYNQIIVLKVPRVVKNEICYAMQHCKNIAGRNVKFNPVMAKSSIKRVKKYLKENFEKEEKMKRRE
ncbi:putative Ribonuclease P/MRP protein subunit protein [Trachipleistophora hominis]|uniref:Ribonuclease P/MRP protein subunit POP5 n=1 Tax=Trachipleistophora hominis TaxID=72359 RepID=L7JYM7_TRAHO|nr:putative Ribonuclease P/MRP protein subunit protein [Trachipleistophora hominis]